MIVDRAERFARIAHEGQVRDDGTTFMTHPTEVARTLAIVAPLDFNLQAAGWLHDVLEDTNTSYATLALAFGEDIASLVHEVTHEPSEHGFYFPRLRTLRGIQLKFADRLSNLAHIRGVWTDDRVVHYVKRSRFWKRHALDT